MNSDPFIVERQEILNETLDNKYRLGPSIFIYGSRQHSYTREDAAGIDVLLKPLYNLARDNKAASWLAQVQCERPPWGDRSIEYPAQQPTPHTHEAVTYGPQLGLKQDISGANEETMVISACAGKIAQEWLSDPIQFSRKHKSTSSREYMRVIVLQMQELDYWLARHKRSGSTCATVDLFQKAMLIRGKLPSSPNKALAYLSSNLHRESPGSMLNYGEETMFLKDLLKEGVVIWSSPNFANRRAVFPSTFDTSVLIEKEDALKFHLVFRAILMGALLSLGTDSSDLLDLETADQIVPFM